VLRLLGILGKGVIRHRHPAKRRRMKTIIQELIQIPARILRGSGQLKLDIGRAPGREAFLALYRSLAAPFPSPA
jgi:crotonobetainyl-CoA:carnitine CoA-transferase CaiB-like acyl-CoA transferase